MKNLFTLIVLALAFSACSTQSDTPMKDQLQGAWQHIAATGEDTLTVSGDVATRSVGGTLIGTYYFEMHYTDDLSRQWAVFTNSSTGLVLYRSGDIMVGLNSQTIKYNPKMAIVFDYKLK